MGFLDIFRIKGKMPLGSARQITNLNLSHSRKRRTCGFISLPEGKSLEYNIIFYYNCGMFRRLLPMIANTNSNWNLFFLCLFKLILLFFFVLLQPQLPANQNGSAASTSGPTSGSGSLGSGSVSASTTMPGSGLAGKPRFIAVTSLDDAQVKPVG